MIKILTTAKYWWSSTIPTSVFANVWIFRCFISFTISPLSTSCQGLYAVLKKTLEISLVKKCWKIGPHLSSNPQRLSLTFLLEGVLGVWEILLKFIIRIFQLGSSKARFLKMKKVWYLDLVLLLLSHLHQQLELTQAAMLVNLSLISTSGLLSNHRHFQIHQAHVLHLITALQTLILEVKALSLLEMRCMFPICSLYPVGFIVAKTSHLWPMVVQGRL